MSTVFITHPDYLKHKAGPGHPERPERLQAIATAIDQSPLGDALERIVPDPVDEEQLAAVHRREYIHQVRDLAAHSGGALDPDTVVSPVSFEVALLSAGGAVAATRAVMEGRAHTAFAAVRPPGHHALPDRGMGFCLFNNAAVAARLVGMRLAAAGFGALAQMVLDARPDRSKVAAVLEGGYKLTHLSNSVLATLAAFTGRSVPVVERSSGGPETPYSVLRSRI